MNYSDNIAELFDFHIHTSTLPSLSVDIKNSSGATIASGECRSCKADLVRYDGDLVCSRCLTVFGGVVPTPSSDPWQSFWDDRSKYDQSKIIRCVGGYPHAYEW